MNEQMLTVLKSKGIYNHVLCSQIKAFKKRKFRKKEKDKILVEELKDGFYDAVVILHGFGQGHLPLDTLWEVDRILKPSEFFH